MVKTRSNRSKDSNLMTKESPHELSKTKISPPDKELDKFIQHISQLTQLELPMLRKTTTPKKISPKQKISPSMTSVVKIL
jgi:hypothetical protein